MALTVASSWLKPPGLLAIRRPDGSDSILGLEAGGFAPAQIPACSAANRPRLLEAASEWGWRPSAARATLKLPEEERGAISTEVDRGWSTPLRRRLPRALLCLLAATALWLPALHLLYRPRLAAWRAESGVSPRGRALAARHLALWTDPALREREVARMRVSNAEWDFMG